MRLRRFWIETAKTSRLSTPRQASAQLAAQLQRQGFPSKALQQALRLLGSPSAVRDSPPAPALLALILETAAVALCAELGSTAGIGARPIRRESDASVGSASTIGSGIAAVTGAYSSGTRGSTEAICPSCRCAKRVRKSLMTAPSPNTNCGALRSCREFPLRANDRLAPAHPPLARAGAPGREFHSIERG